MKYMVLMYSNPAQTKAMSASELDAVMRKHNALRDELTESGELLSGAGLAYPEDTTTIRLRAGAGVAVAGPLMESDEQLTAYYVFECADVERARHIAEGVLDFHVTAVEVRAIHDSVGM